jgi:hypothetical protein
MSDDALKRLKERAKRGVPLASRVATIDLTPYVARVCAALGHPKALTTDESVVADFLEINGDRILRSGAALTTAQQKLGVPIAREDRIVAVAKLVAELENRRA